MTTKLSRLLNDRNIQPVTPPRAILGGHNMVIGANFEASDEDVLKCAVESTTYTGWGILERSRDEQFWFFLVSR